MYLNHKNQKRVPFHTLLAHMYSHCGITLQPSIWSQLLPAVIGAIIGALATVIATQKNISAITEQSKKDEERRRRNEEKQAKNWISAEIQQINEMTKDILRSRKFPNQAWEANKMYLDIWTPKEQKNSYRFV